MATQRPGVAFPADSRGERSTTAAGKQIFATAVRDVDPTLAERLLGERDWRHRYPTHLMGLLEVSLRRPNYAVAVARAGLASAHAAFEFIRNSTVMPLSEALQAYTDPAFHTATIQGQRQHQPVPPAVPVNGIRLEGEPLLQQLQAWADHGSIEPDVVQAVRAVQQHPEWTDLRGRNFVIFGAASEMGPLPHLLQRGAHVIAIGTRKPQRWSKLFDLARNSSGTLSFPVRSEPGPGASDDELTRDAGCDLLVDTPEIRTWLRSVAKAPLTIGMYVYMDGEAHVRASMAVDALTADLVEHLGADNVSLAFLGSPAVGCPVPEAAHQAAQGNYQAASWWHTPLSWVCGGFTPNAQPPVTAENGDKFFVNDGYAVVQGPNYALAKTLQMWRAMVAQADGMVVSTPMAPAAKSDSVMHNPQVAAAMEGLHHFPPLQAFTPDTASALMAALLLHDLHNPTAVAHPGRTRRNPLELFAATAVHGGSWRCGYKLDSLGKGLYVCGKVAPETRGEGARAC